MYRRAEALYSEERVLWSRERRRSTARWLSVQRSPPLPPGMIRMISQRAINTTTRILRREYGTKSDRSTFVGSGPYISISNRYCGVRVASHYGTSPPNGEARRRGRPPRTVGSTKDKNSSTVEKTSYRTLVLNERQVRIKCTAPYTCTIFNTQTKSATPSRNLTMASRNADAIAGSADAGGIHVAASTKNAADTESAS